MTDAQLEPVGTTPAGAPPADPAADPATDPASTAPGPAPAPRRRRRIDKGLLAVSMVVAVGLVLVVRGFLVGVTGDDRVNMPDAVTDVEPVPEAVQVLRQTGVYVDLDTGYTGELTIDGVTIPTVSIEDYAADEKATAGAQVDLPPVTIYEPGNATLTFTPSDDAPVDEFDSGEHRVRLVFWPVEEGRARARSFTWTFSVI